MKKLFIVALMLTATVQITNSCRDSDLEPALTQDQDINTAITTANDLKTVLNSAYDYMSLATYYGRDYIIYGEVRTDNAYSNANSNRFVTVGQMNMVSSDAYPTNTWTRIYQVIASCNIVINSDLTKISGDTNVINHTVGEALVLRAMAHFDLVKLFGQQHVGAGGMSALGIPYIKTFGNSANAAPKRNTVQEVYDNAMADINQGLAMMPVANDNSNKHFITTGAANALKARIALYFKKYDVAKAAALAVINSAKYSIATSANFASTFTTDSTSNQIFSIANSATDNVGNDGLANIFRGSYGDVVMLDDLYSKYGAADVRKSMFTVLTAGSTYRNIGKYPANNSTADTPIIRYEEVILTYAEAALLTGENGNALTYLNMIPANRGASPYTTATLENILLERRKEFASEGLRFWDLARTGQSMPNVSSLQTYGTVAYGSYKYAFPIPLAEMNANSSMIQNKDY